MQNFQDNNTYHIFSNYFVKDVPSVNMEFLIILFLKKASLNMGAGFEEKNQKGKDLIQGVVEIIKYNYSYIPVFYIASGFVKGSLGHYGPGRLVPATIYKWMEQISLEYNRDQAKKIQEEKMNDVSIAMDLHKYPIGQAIIKKLDWFKEGKLNGDRWDRINLRELTEAIARKEFIEFENFFK
jgi:hypothetical protein